MVTDSLNAGANPSILADSVWLLSSFSNKFNTNVSVQKGDSLKTKTLAFMRGAGHGEYDKTAFASNDPVQHTDKDQPSCR